MDIGFIGVGNMASAIIGGLVKEIEPKNIHIMNRTKSKADVFKKEGINVYEYADDVINKSDIVILAIKPNQYKTWLEKHNLGEKILISIAAGIDSAFLSKYVKKFVITMPNTPAAVAKGTTLIVENEWVNEDVISIFSAIGSTKLINEVDLEKYMMVTGCSPAYYFSFVDNLATSLSEYFALDQSEIEELLIDVMQGSLEMLKQQKTAAELCSDVCSPNGVTIQVVDALNEDLNSTLKRGYTNAIKRNRELK